MFEQKNNHGLFKTVAGNPMLQNRKRSMEKNIVSTISATTRSQTEHQIPMRRSEELFRSLKVWPKHVTQQANTWQNQTGHTSGHLIHHTGTREESLPAARQGISGGSKVGGSGDTAASEQRRRDELDTSSYFEGTGPQAKDRF